MFRSKDLQEIFFNKLQAYFVLSHSYLIAQYYNTYQSWLITIRG